MLFDWTPAKTGRKPEGLRAMTGGERQKRLRARKREEKLSNIAILDFETDPFDSEGNTIVQPFLAVLYADHFEPVVIWEEDFDTFVSQVITAIEALPDEYVIYAHNGGKFDFMFLIHRIRGEVMFKGRGIMSARIGKHELRDSMHIIPERLANWQKDDFDYRLLRKDKRNKHREEIIRYCINDCKYLLEIVLRFVKEFGFKISIGQAAMSALKKHYKPGKLSAFSDEYIRERYFFGGRVECLQGRGQFNGEYKLYDVNSMYPFVMAGYQHPLGNDFTRRPGRPSAATNFIHLRCKNNRALVGRGEDGSTTADIEDGEFYTTIWEYNVAKKYNLIWDEEIIDCIDWSERSDFSKFVLPLYNQRQIIKPQLKALAMQDKEESYEFRELKKDDMIIKYVLNNAYGKFAQNPRRYKEHYITDENGRPPEWWFDEITEEQRDDYLLPHFNSPRYAIWERPNPSKHFNNVATGASITGAARAVLLEAIQNAREPIYCDTDSLICLELKNTNHDVAQLGAWKLEAEFTDVLIAGKKLYATKLKGKESGQREALKVRSKGVNILQLENLDKQSDILRKQQKAWDDMQAMLDGQIMEFIAKGSTLTRYGEQYYMKRNVRATAPLRTRQREPLKGRIYGT